MPRTGRTGRLAAAVGAVALAVLMPVVSAAPAAAEADTYTCNDGNLYKNGENLGSYTESSPYDMGGGVTTWCKGDRIVTRFPVSD